MTTQEMYNRIALKVQKVDSFAFDTFRAPELDLILNDAQLAFIKQRANLRSDPKQAGFARNQKRLNDLRVLITPLSQDIEDSQIPGTGEEFGFELPEDFMLEAETRAKFKVAWDQDAPHVPRLINVRIVENDRFYEDMQNPFRCPTASSLPGYIQGNQLVVKPKEKYILLGLRGSYIRIPRKIDLSSNCELPEHTHTEIVDLAVTQLLEILESRRYQSSKLEASQSE